MATVMEPLVETESRRRPMVRSYDAEYEHSLEHHLEVRRMVEEADEEKPAPMQLRGILPI